MPTCPQPAWKHLDRKFQGPEGGTQAPSMCIPLAWRTPQPLGRSVAGEGPEQSPLGVELRGVTSLGWDCTRLMVRHIQNLLPSTWSLSSGTTDVLASLKHLRTEGSVSHFIFVFSRMH